MAALAAVVLAAGVAGTGYLYVNHELSSIHRIQGITALTAAHQPIVPARFRQGMTVLVTGSDMMLGPSSDVRGLSGLIALVHLNASQQGGAVVSIPANALVNVPGFGYQPLWDALRIGGPSLLITTVEHLTGVRIDHYSVLSFYGVRSIVAALHGVDVWVPRTVVSMGYLFHRGLNHLNFSTVLPYVRQPQVSEIGRVLLQSNLIRAILTKIARQGLFRQPTVDWALLHTMASTLSLDSSFTNADIIRLALRLGHLDSSSGVFVSAPTVNGSPFSGGTLPVQLNQRISHLLWQAIRHDSVAAFARRFPFTVTPTAPA